MVQTELYCSLELLHSMRAREGGGNEIALGCCLQGRKQEKGWMLTLIDCQSHTRSQYNYAPGSLSQDAEGFDVRQWDASASPSRSRPCVAKLIGSETAGNICTCGRALHCVFAFDGPRPMTPRRSSTCRDDLTIIQHTWHVCAHSRIRRWQCLDNYFPHSVCVPAHLTSHSWLSVLYE